MTSMQRVLTTLGHQEPDRVPFFLLLSMYGAKILGTAIQDYFSRAENVVEGQLRMRQMFQHDCYYTFYYASLEMEAWGGSTIFSEDGPPTSGALTIKSFEQIDALQVPSVRASHALQKVLQTTAALKKHAGDEVPIIGVVMSPYSLPVMQMGFDKYLELIYRRREQFDKLMSLNEAFCIEWANAQLEAGATAICYFDPLASPSIIPRDVFLDTGYHVAKRTIAGIKGPTALHLASAKGMPILGDLAQAGPGAVAVSAEESLAQIKEECKNKLTVIGNLNGIAMRRWSRDETFAYVKSAIADGGQGGGFILSDNHGEIPWQVPQEVLSWVSQAVREYGTYPLEWVEGNV